MDIAQVTYMNSSLLALGLKELGYKGLSVRDIDGLAAAGADGDRREYFDTGCKIIVPAPFTGPWKNYNVDVQFGLSFNSDGADDDEWIDFDTTATQDSNYLQELPELFFFKYVVRNNDTDVPVLPEFSTVRLYVIQNPFWMVQLNKLLKDVVR